jgi:hypothetical protein
MPSVDKNVTRIADEITRYLASRPAAADSLDGILQWWLPRQRYEDSKREVAAALALLEQQNIVRKTGLADGTVIYAKR